MEAANRGREAVRAEGEGEERAATRRRAVLELSVRNHPGVMSHVCGLFARRGYNLEAILCLPAPDGGTSRMWLLVDEDGRLPQVERQVEKLVDVLSLRRHGAGRDAFARAEELFRG